MEISWGAWDSFLHYLPYSEEDDRLGMVCTTAGCIKVAPNTVYPPHKNEHPLLFRQVAESRILPEFQLVYITEGQGGFSITDRTYNVSPGSMLLILPGIRHTYKPVYEIGWHEYWVGFKGDFFFNMIRQDLLSQGHLFFDLGLRDTIILAFNNIFDEVRAQRPLYQLKACVGILSLLTEMLTHERRKEQPNYYQTIVERAKCLMESNVYGTINLSHISQKIGISTSRLNEIFKTYTSMTPYQFYIHIKIHKAESLLEQENVSVKEVAYKLGFEDQYYFSRLFKNKTGIAPSVWKKFVTPPRALSNYSAGL
ncbi:MAG: AraC family transcriptional regulator [Spirochaetaceae bacterium]|jgi:AraC-like DNA-binding protein|nr:AraC family transcriptional regulator [Spirochaetaceae bacterium]